MRGAGSKNSWALFLLILAGIVLGGFIGMLAQDTGALSWLNYGQTFGLDEPVVLDLGILVLTFGLSVRITIASIIGMVLAIIIYRLTGPLWECYRCLQKMTQKSTNTMKSLLESERPYEKCERLGEKNLSDAELLAVLLRTGTKGENVLELCRRIQEAAASTHCTDLRGKDFRR